jgi:hypothetical protein
VKNHPLPRRLTWFAILLAGFFGLVATSTSRAQVTVDISIKRNIYVAYEPLSVIVRITNLSGRPLLLADIQGKKWFGFEVETLEGAPIPPNNSDREEKPLEIKAGESITCPYDLSQLFPLGDLGSYRVRARVYAAELSSYFTSPPLTVEITEGKVIWQQIVGAPAQEGLQDSTRTISLLSHRLDDHTDLYLRIENKPAGVIYCTHRLGDYIAFGKPEILLDRENTIYVLQNNKPREFIFSKVGLNGKILERTPYSAPKDRPQLVEDQEGGVKVLGGIPFDPKATPTPFTPAKLSDRPAPMGGEVPSLIPEGSPKKSTAKPTPSPSPKPIHPKASPIPQGRVD